ncbi:MAG: hypothetical protein ACR2OE_12100 [Thermomicrobiales bacterium]
MFNGLDSYDEWTHDNAPDAGSPPDFPELDERNRLDFTLEEIQLERVSLSDLDLILREGFADGYGADSALRFLADVEARHGLRTRCLLADYLVNIGSDSAPAS